VSVLCPSVRLYQRGFRWTDFHEILCLELLRRCVKKVQFFFKLPKLTDILREDVRTFYCRRNEFAIKACLYNTQYFYIAYSDMQTNNRHRMLLFHCNNGYANATQCHVMRTLPYLVPIHEIQEICLKLQNDSILYF